MTITHSFPSSTFCLFWRRDTEMKLVAENLSAGETQRRLEVLAEQAGQPILPGNIVHESSEPGCGYYYAVEHL